MSEHPVPEPCRLALAAIQADPLELPVDTRAHLRTCPACRETRVQWLAQEDSPFPAPPRGYFESLPLRILRKLPSRRVPNPQAGYWLAAAALALAVGIGGFVAGRLLGTEASPPEDVIELLEFSFEEPEDAVSQLSTLSPEDAEAVLDRLDTSQNPRH